MSQLLRGKSLAPTRRLALGMMNKMLRQFILYIVVIKQGFAFLTRLLSFLFYHQSKN